MSALTWVHTLPLPCEESRLPVWVSTSIAPAMNNAIHLKRMMRATYVLAIRAVPVKAGLFTRSTSSHMDSSYGLFIVKRADIVG